MHVVPELANDVRAAALAMLTSPGVTVPVHGATWICGRQVPARHTELESQATLFAQVVPQESTKLRLTSQPLLLTPSQFLVPDAQVMQPALPTHFWSSAVQLTAVPQRPSDPQVCEALLVPTQRFWLGMHSVNTPPPEPPLLALPAPVPPFDVPPEPPFAPMVPPVPVVPPAPFVPPPPNGPPPPGMISPPLHR